MKNEHEVNLNPSIHVSDSLPELFQYPYETISYIETGLACILSLGALIATYFALHSGFFYESDPVERFLILNVGYVAAGIYTIGSKIIGFIIVRKLGDLIDSPWLPAFIFAIILALSAYDLVHDLIGLNWLYNIAR